MFGVSTAFGIYFGCFRNQATTKDYYHGGKKMKVYPITMSLVASSLSGITLIGLPTEVYMYGSQVSLLAFSIVFVTVINYYMYLPVFYKLQCISSYKYLELRFDKTIKNVASLFYTITNLLFLPVIIYAPSLAFNQVSGFSVHLIAAIMSTICIFYTSIGGLKAVVWSDTLQMSITLLCLGFVLIMGTFSVGGFSKVLEISKAGDRLDIFNMDIDPTVKCTFWSVLVGNIFLWSGLISTDPSYIQRFLSMPSFNDAKKALLGFGVLTATAKIISCFSGLIMYAKYFDCDPLSAGYITKSDQILPYYVLEVASQIPGISGLFVAGLFSTALSTLSTFLNTLSGIWYNDFIMPCMPVNTTEKTSNIIMKLISVIIGVIVISLVFVVEKLGSVFEAYQCVYGIAAGAIFGMFMLGMLFPFANNKGAITGSIISMLLMSVIVINKQIYIWDGTITYPPKILQTYGCNLTAEERSFNSSYISSSIKTILSDSPSVKPFWLFRISIHYYCAIGTLTTVIIGVIVSWITKNQNKLPINPTLLSPLVQKFLYTKTIVRYASAEIDLNCTKN